MPAPAGTRDRMEASLTMTWNLLASIFSIVVIDIVLSGDNALVIGMASHRLVARQRRWAIIFGGAGAIVLRMMFTAAAVILLDVPFLQAIGGLVLTWIAYKLLREESESAREVQAKDSLAAAIRTIVLADVVMSLDNILAVGGAAHGSFELLIFGLLLSMPLILFGSSVIARLMNRFAWLTVVGSVVLTITAARMIADDRLVARVLGEEMHVFALLGLAVLLSLVVLVPTFMRRRAAQPMVELEPRPTSQIPPVTRDVEREGVGRG